MADGLVEARCKLVDATTQERMVNVIDGWFDGVIITAE